MAHTNTIIVCGTATDIVRPLLLKNHSGPGGNPLPAFKCQYCGTLFIVGSHKDRPPDHECGGPEGRIDF
jgi:hypothetical protein